MIINKYSGVEDGFGAVPGGCQVICVPSAVVWVWMENGKFSIQTPTCKKQNKKKKKTDKKPNPTPEWGSRLRWAKSPELFWGDGDKHLCKGAGAVGPGINFHSGNSNEWNVFEMLKAFQIFTPSWASCQILAAPVTLIRGWCVTVWGSGAGRCTDCLF